MARSIVGFACLVGLNLLPGCGKEHWGHNRAQVSEGEGALVVREALASSEARRSLEAACKTEYPSHEPESMPGASVDASGRSNAPFRVATLAYPSASGCSESGGDCMDV